MAEGYLIRNGTWRLLGSELTKHRLQDWTEIPGGPVRIEPGDVIASRCLYINENDTPVKFGLTHKEEMCVFEIDFGFEDQYQDEFKRPLGCIETSPTFSFCKVKPLESVCNNYKL
ncbi:peptidyl-glycine alpha-amidating monooxygenase A-like [Saccostrea cucullata]|uniref:peptidyl-glycine alpha-amidating monooxygenase A-like n=1 Tax=Saccostrea cuccullata TaxID=36930 RepID=UPI002ED475C5